MQKCAYDQTTFKI